MHNLLIKYLIFIYILYTLGRSMLDVFSPTKVPKDITHSKAIKRNTQQFVQPLFNFILFIP